MNGRYRVKCPKCGNVCDISAPTQCQCGQQLVHLGGEVQLYRMGNFWGALGGFGVYIDDQPCGYIGNQETVAYSLPFGTHKFHVAVGMSRKCEDILVTLTPENPVGYLKVHMRVGFWTNSFVIEPSTAAEMPRIQY